MELLWTLILSGGLVALIMANAELINIASVARNVPAAVVAATLLAILYLECAALLTGAQSMVTLSHQLAQ